MTAVAVLVYNLALLLGTAYVVFGLGESGWWFVAAYCFMMQTKDKEDGC